ncbi:MULTISPECIES: hypothetical protein [Aneurinibacillus]|uniref:Uncharacterized protein n=1 Tax=Aneurinibacillus thermoaerophilus TaxID=143495 RepID=A0A1G7YEB3_ANETH|nr:MULTISPECIES: hypothetical protein [Aneurinibacillus]AMA72197.1 hypothetical protein ACH33_04565 [Aneurinibacillus sp. XH2]MED0676484.1 hypothetical protein [Aneurinibacillus thermoaerophilus]MED0678996.1 hypothetical protein [Aneurinibacillus thermoaerophilus]MED0736534.1 hypothetical protein [Aneurinibacillus thermoaerophilus]MED0756037.1 hypothetical protein [Aneurinibacillus thermoaerophilus]
MKQKQSSATHENQKMTVYAASNCQGKSGTESTWYGSIVYYNSCQANAIVGLLTSGTGATATAAALAAYHNKPVTALYTGVAAGLMTIGAGVVSAANAWGTGITIRYVDSYITSDLPFWVWAQ